MPKLDREASPSLQFSELPDEFLRTEGRLSQLRKVRRWESHDSVAKELQLAQTVLREHQKTLDRLGIQTQSKEKRLTSLLSTLSALPDPSNPSFLQSNKALYQLQAELNETNHGYRNEMYSEQTLIHMIESREASLHARLKPLHHLKSTLASISLSLTSIKQHNQDIFASLETEQINLSDLIAERRKAKESTEILLRSEAETYKNKQKLLLFLRKSREIATGEEKNRYLGQSIEELEGILRRIQDEESNKYEFHHLERQTKAEERRFKEIRSSINIGSILDMEPYWWYLTENRTRLEGLAKEGEDWVEKLKRKREDYKEELRGLMEEGWDRGTRLQEMDEINTHISAKTRDLSANETRLIELERLLASATNIIGLIAAMLMGTSEALDVKPSNAASYLSFCCTTLSALQASL